MKNLPDQIQDALCANHEILTFLPALLARFEVSADLAEPIRRALMLFQTGLLAAAMVPSEVDGGTVAEMVASHAEIAAHVAEALEKARAPLELSGQVAAVFVEFATGLQALTTTTSSLDATTTSSLDVGSTTTTTTETAAE